MPYAYYMTHLREVLSWRLNRGYINANKPLLKNTEILQATHNFTRDLILILFTILMNVQPVGN